MLHCGTVCGGRVQEGIMPLILALCWLSVISPSTHKQIGPFVCCFLGGWVCVCSRTLWFSLVSSPVMLGVHHNSHRFYSQRFCGFFFLPCWNPGLRGLSRSTVFPPGLSACKCGITWSASCHLTCPGPPAATLPRVLSIPAARFCPSFQSG